MSEITNPLEAFSPKEIALMMVLGERVNRNKLKPQDYEFISKALWALSFPQALNKYIEIENLLEDDSDDCERLKNSYRVEQIENFQYIYRRLTFSGLCREFNIESARIKH